MSEPTTIELTRGSCELLNSMLGQNNWTNKRREITAAGHVAEKLEPMIEDRPIYTGVIQNGTPVDMIEWDKYNKTVKEWTRKKWALLLTDPEYQSVIVCIKHFSEEKKVPSTIYAAQLLEAFKLSE